MRTNQPTQILVVDDDPELRDLLREYLSQQGFAVSVMHDGDGLQARLERERPALIVLDLMMPKVDGLTALRNLRAKNDDIPVILLTARSDEIDRIVGLEIGADDYVVKPFSPRELAARVRAILRRARGGGATVAKGDEVAGFTHDKDGARLAYRGRWLELTRYEYLLLAWLVAHPGRVYSRAQLMECVWADALDTSDRTVDTHIKTLRAKLREASTDGAPEGAERIRTHRGMGYSLEP